MAQNIRSIFTALTETITFLTEGSKRSLQKAESDQAEGDKVGIKACEAAVATSAFSGLLAGGVADADNIAQLCASGFAIPPNVIQATVASLDARLGALSGARKQHEEAVKALNAHADSQAAAAAAAKASLQGGGGGNNTGGKGPGPKAPAPKPATGGTDAKPPVNDPKTPPTK
jgi:hypothetical protein